MKQQMMQLLRLLLSLVCGVGVLWLVVTVAILVSVNIALSSDQVMAVAEVEPLLERLVWPLFILILIFLYKDEVSNVLKELPGIIHRSYLPYSEVPHNQGEPDEAHSLVSKQGYDEGTHREKVKCVMARIELEFGVRVIPNVALPNSVFVCDGGYCDKMGVKYIAVLPFVLGRRVDDVISRVNEAVRIGGRNVTMIICFYDCSKENMSTFPEIGMKRQNANHDVQFKFYFEGLI